MAIAIWRDISRCGGQILHLGQNFFGVPRHFYLTPDVCDVPRCIDHKGGALNAHIGAPIHAFLLPYPKSFGHLRVIIAGERDGEAIFFAKLLMGGQRIL